MEGLNLLLMGRVLAQVLDQLASGTLKHSSSMQEPAPGAWCSVSRPGLGPAPRGALLPSSSYCPVARRDIRHSVLLEKVINFWASAGHWLWVHRLLPVLGGRGAKVRETWQ